MIAVDLGTVDHCAGFLVAIPTCYRSITTALISYSISNEDFPNSTLITIEIWHCREFLKSVQDSLGSGH